MEPFKIRYVEIGNEDFFSCTYHYRFPYLYKALKQAYPNITFISTQFDQNKAGGYNKNCNDTIDIPEGAAIDLHNYKVSARADF